MKHNTTPIHGKTQYPLEKNKNNNNSSYEKNKLFTNFKKSYTVAPFHTQPVQGQNRPRFTRFRVTEVRYQPRPKYHDF